MTSPPAVSSCSTVYPSPAVVSSRFVQYAGLFWWFFLAIVAAATVVSAAYYFLHQMSIRRRKMRGG